MRIFTHADAALSFLLLLLLPTVLPRLQFFFLKKAERLQWDVRTENAKMQSMLRRSYFFFAIMQWKVRRSYIYRTDEMPGERSIQPLQHELARHRTEDRNREALGEEAPKNWRPASRTWSHQWLGHRLILTHMPWTTTFLAAVLRFVPFTFFFFWTPVPTISSYQKASCCSSYRGSVV